MPSTFQVRVEDIIGTVGDTAALGDWLTAGASAIIDFLPFNIAEKHTVELTDSGAGVSVSGYRVFRAHKSGYEARKILSGFKIKSYANGALAEVYVAAAGSGYAVNNVLTVGGGSSGTCTVTAIDGSGGVTALTITTGGNNYTRGVQTTTGGAGTNCTVYVVPTGTSLYAATAKDPIYYIENGSLYVMPGGGRGIALAYPTVVYSATSISNFPIQLEHAVVLYACIQGRIRQLSDILITTMGGLSLTLPTVPTLISAPSYTWSDASVGTITGTTIGAFSTPPAYTKPTIVLSTVIDDLDTSGINIPNAPADFTLTVTPPTAPTDANYSYTDAILGTYTATTIGSLGTAPTYIKPTTTFSAANISTYIATDEDLEKAQTEISHQSSLLQLFSADIQNELNEFNKENVEYQATVQKAIEQARLDQERLLTVGKDTTNLNLQNKANALTGQIELYRAKLAKYNAELISYQQEANAQVNSYQQLLGKYAETLNSVKVQVDKAVQQFRANLEKRTLLRNTELQQYSNDIQNELNEFNKENIEYQSSIQKAIHQADLDQQRLIEAARMTTDVNLQNKIQNVKTEIEEYRDTLQKYLADVQSYSSQIQIRVAEYNGNIQRVLSQYQGMEQQLEKIKREYNDIIKIYLGVQNGE